MVSDSITRLLRTFATSKHAVLQKLGQLQSIQFWIISKMINMRCGHKVACPDLTPSLPLLLYERFHRTCRNDSVCRAIDVQLWTAWLSGR